MKDRRITRKLDTGTALVIAVTVVLFGVAIVVKGVGKDLLLEAGVLMVSIKLIMMSFKNAAESQAMREDLDQIVTLLENRSAAAGSPSTIECTTT